MPAPKRPGPGRPPGSPNKATVNAREAIARLVDDNAPMLRQWLADIAAKDGSKAAFTCMMDLLEYHVPKLARTELVGKDGKDLMPKVVVLKVEP